MRLFYSGMLGGQKSIYPENIIADADVMIAYTYFVKHNKGSKRLDKFRKQRKAKGGKRGNR